jgi:hypothetical protein
MIYVPPREFVINGDMIPPRVKKFNGIYSYFTFSFKYKIVESVDFCNKHVLLLGVEKQNPLSSKFLDP